MKSVWTVVTAVAVLSAPIAWASLNRAAPTAAAATVENAALPVASAAQVVQRSMPSDLQVRSVSGPEGAAVQEYIAADGTLFAVTWTSTRVVSPETIAHTYFGEGTRHGLRLVVQGSHQSWGYQGVAYAPALMPLDFDPHSLAP